MCVLRPSAVSNSLRSPGLWPARLLCLWNFSGKNNGAGLEFPPPGDLPHPEIEHASPALAGRFFTISATCLGKKLLHKTPRCLTDPRVREAAFPPPLGKYIVCLCFKQWRSVLGSFWLPGWLSGKESACRTADVEMWVRSLGREDPLEEEMETPSSVLAWRIPWTEEPGGLQFMGSQKSQTERLNNNN